MHSWPNRARTGHSSHTNQSENVLKPGALVPKYGMRWSRQARKELEDFPQKMAERVYEAVGQLQTTPRLSGSLKLKGGSGVWRFRVGDYRILYTIDDGICIVSILAVQHRKDVYRGL